MRFILIAGAGLLLAFSARAQFFVSGQLLDEHQQPVPFASIALADGQAGTASNEVGGFSLRLPALPQQLTVLSIGYERAVINVVQAGPLPAAVVLRASAVRLPEVTVRANGEAEELVRRCYAKLLRHQNDVQYGRGFYRQKTRQNGRYRELFDAFYDVKLTPRNMPSWVLGEARYAFTPGGFTLRNMSSFTRQVPLFQTTPAQPGQSLLPLRPDATTYFTFALRQTLRENGRQLAVIDFAPQPGVALASRGTLYLDPQSLAVFRIEQTLPQGVLTFPQSNAAFTPEQVTVRMTAEYVPQHDSLTRLASLRQVTTINATVQGFADKIELTSSFLLFEVGPPAPGQHYPDTDPKVDDLTAIKKRRYHPAFWRDNAVVKDSPVEEQIIQDFEGRKVFGKLN